jgi:hypothetical protein
VLNSQAIATRQKLINVIAMRSYFTGNENRIFSIIALPRFFPLAPSPISAVQLKKKKEFIFRETHVLY